MGKMEPGERYQKDPIFKNLVELLYEKMEEYGWTLQEIFSAAMIAAVKYEFFHKDDPQNRF